MKDWNQHFAITRVMIYMESMRIEKATAQDADAVLAMVHSLSRWLLSKGVHQWSDAFPNSILENEVAAGELFVVRKDNEIIASVALGRKGGELWDNIDDVAVYLHRLMVIRKYAGKKIGHSVVACVEEKCRSWGVPLLRLETDVKNDFLQKYYQDLGFAPKGIKHYTPYNMDFARFEKEL